MKSVLIMAIVVAVMIITATVFLLPSNEASTTGFVALASNKSKIDSYFVNGSLRADMISSINSHIKNVPDSVLGLFGKSRINIYVQFDDSTTRSYWARMENNQLKELKQGARSEADNELKVKESTVNRITGSPKPLDEFLGAMNSGEISYRGLNSEGKVRSMFVRATTYFFEIANKGLRFFGIAK